MAAKKDWLTKGMNIDLECAGGVLPSVYPGSILSAGDLMVSVRLFTPPGIPVPLKTGTEIRAGVVRQGTLCTFESKVLGRYRNDDGVRIDLAVPTDVREHRREYFRLDWQLPVVLDVPAPTGPDGEPEGEAQRVEGMTCDISGGGIGLVSPYLIPAGTRVEVHLDLVDAETVTVPAGGHVAFVAEQPAAKPAYRLAVAFDDIRTPDRERIIAYIFKKQRELRSSGRL